MGNITRMSVKRTLTDDEWTVAFQEINERRFGGYFKITYDGHWSFEAPDFRFRDQPITWSVWDFYRESPRRLGGKSPRPNPMWIMWAWWQFMTEITLKYGGVITDEGITESIKPAEYEGETFIQYLARWRTYAYSDYERQRIDDILARKDETQAQRFDLVPKAFVPVAFPDLEEDT
jgi:hypothetical protein